MAHSLTFLQKQSNK